MTARVKLTAGRGESFACPPDKSQAFLWDTDTPCLALRATPTGRTIYVFESRLNGQTIRVSIGTVAEWPIKKAQERAAALKRMVDTGTDPREVERQQVAAKVERAATVAAESLTVGAATVEAWASQESKTRPVRVRLALRLLKAFLRWAAAESDLKGRADPTAASAKKAREAAGRAEPKDDVLERGQLSAWFDTVRQLGNLVISAYLQTLLMTGARPGEVLALRWVDINTQWKGLTIRDKVEGERAISMDEKNKARRTRRHAEQGSTEASAGELAVVSASGRLVEPSIAHRQACAAAGLEGLTLHGLRRSFASLTEWLEIPAGVVAQIQGHKPSATAEKHDKRRPLDLLRVHHERIEAWILEQACIEQPSASEEGGLRVVHSR